jgi:hypothetical protein
MRHSGRLAQASLVLAAALLLVAPDIDELRNDVGERLSRVDLMRARGTKQRLNLRRDSE